MQEINLLQNKLKDTTSRWEQSNRTVVIILGLVIIVELVAAGLFYFLGKNAQDSKLAMDQENVTLQSKLEQMEQDLSDAKGFQAQAQNIKTLLNNHVTWIPIIDSFAASTFKNSRYLSATVSTTGVLHVEGVTSTYSDLGKTILALQTNKDISSVQLLSLSPSTAQQAGVMFSLEIEMQPALFLTRD
jgi:hypothetical protein